MVHFENVLVYIMAGANSRSLILISSVGGATVRKRRDATEEDNSNSEQTPKTRRHFK